MAKLRVGVIGTGSIGNVHLTGYAADPKNVTIQAIADHTGRRLGELGESYGVTSEHQYTDWKKMLATEQLDAVSICLPNAFHFDAAAEAIKRGVNTLIEKPMVLTLEHARKLKALHAKNPVKVMVAFSHRFIAPNIAAKKAIDKGVIGKPFMVRMRFAHSGPYPGWAQGDWFYKKQLAGGGAVLDMGIHAIDMCQHLIGPIKSVMAEVRTLRKPVPVDDNAVMVFDFGNDAKALGYVEVGWTSGPGFGGIEVYGDKGTIICELGKPGRLIRGVNKPDGTLEITSEDLKETETKSHWPLQMESWIKHLLDKKTAAAIPGIKEGTSSLAVALAAIESTKTGKRIKIKQP